jgi:hypothetical protein
MKIDLGFQLFKSTFYLSWCSLPRGVLLAQGEGVGGLQPSQLHAVRQGQQQGLRRVGGHGAPGNQCTKRSFVFFFLYSNRKRNIFFYLFCAIYKHKQRWWKCTNHNIKVSFLKKRRKSIKHLFQDKRKKL